MFPLIMHFPALQVIDSKPTIDTPFAKLLIEVKVLYFVIIFHDWVRMPKYYSFSQYCPNMRQLLALLILVYQYKKIHNRLPKYFLVDHCRRGHKNKELQNNIIAVIVEHIVNELVP